MTTDTKHETSIVVDSALPVIHITREFDAPPSAVFRAHVDQDLVVRWMAPRGIEIAIDRWNASTGGNYRFSHTGEDWGSHWFYGSFHEVRPNERIVQTFTYEPMPEGVCLETLTFDDLGDGRTRLRVLSVYESMEIRDQVVASGMAHGVVEVYERLDGLVAG